MGDDLAADSGFDSRWELTTAAGEKRAGGHFTELHAMKTGQEDAILHWQGKLEPANYTLIWGAPDYGSLKANYTVEETKAGWQITGLSIEKSTRYLLLD